ncbi:hypothetical protein CVT24_012909 [Panaeolus cyanescens]|uniref:Uncharacterized protein n=1 Tax=Panaeolus cyanescens TaxID=181874 RepID=A0A409WUL2_9AGAR|nr:hypothetical protein CVT24_012909 [Panaeolus cyanescens]
MHLSDLHLFFPPLFAICFALLCQLLMSSDETAKPGVDTKETKEEEYTVLSPSTAAGIRAMREADTKRPRVTVLSPPSPFNKPKLSKTAANWDTWLWDMEMHLGSAGFWDYIKDSSTVLAPHAEYQPLAFANYRANSNAARYFLIANVDAKEAQQYNLLAQTTPYDLRARLEAIYAKPGPTLQLRLMERCFQTFLVNDAKMIDSFDDLMDTALRSFKNMTVNTWQCLIGARAMGRDLSLAQAKETVVGAMAAAESAGNADSFTASHIREILLRHHNDTATANIADVVHVDSTTPDIAPDLLAHAVSIPYEDFAAFISPDNTDDTDALISSDAPDADQSVPFIADNHLDYNEEEIYDHTAPEPPSNASPPVAAPIPTEKRSPRLAQKSQNAPPTKEDRLRAAVENSREALFSPL